MQALIGLKKVQSQRFLENGMRIPVTLIDVKDNWVVSHKTQENDKYQAVQLGFGIKKRSTKAEIGHANKGAKRDLAPNFLREIRIVDESETLPEIGSTINPSEVFQPGDVVDVIGVSKGKGFAGGVKRHGFHGGPKTHGQSDRHRAPGSIGQGTTPGRVYRGKKMAGRMGSENVTIQNLKVIDITADGVLIVKGLVPGVINGLLMISKVGETKKFVPLFRDPEVVAAEEAAAKVAQDEADKVAADEAAKTEAEEAAPSEPVDASNPSEGASAPVEDVAAEVSEEINEESKETVDVENSDEPKEEVKDGDK